MSQGSEVRTTSSTSGASSQRRNQLDTRPGEYTVRRGDNLSHIAKDNGISLKSLIDANPQIANPDLIHPGQAINLPPRGTGISSDPTPSGPSVGQRTPIRPGSERFDPGGLSNSSRRSALEANLPLARGSRGPEVENTQRRLTELGYDPGTADGVFGSRTQNALRDFQRANSLDPTGTLTAPTKDKLASENAARRPDLSGPTAPNLTRYEPGSPEAIALFREAAQKAGVPESWASSSGLHNILRRESNGQVGIPNYTYGERARDPARWGEIHNELKNGDITARSSATGLGQLLLSNVDRYYPNGHAGIGDPVQEAAGMLSYIKDRYGSPETAWSQYGKNHEGY